MIWSKLYFESIINYVWNIFTCKSYVSVWDKNWLPICFSKKLFFFKIPSFWIFTQASGKYLLNTQKIFTYPLGIYPPHITSHNTSCRHLISSGQLNGLWIFQIFCSYFPVLLLFPAKKKLAKQRSFQSCYVFRDIFIIFSAWHVHNSCFFKKA